MGCQGWQSSIKRVPETPAIAGSAKSIRYREHQENDFMVGIGRGDLAPYPLRQTYRLDTTLPVTVTATINIPDTIRGKAYLRAYPGIPIPIRQLFINFSKVYKSVLKAL